MPPRPRALVALSGYACEGGLDGPHRPATCFAPTIALGRHRGPAQAEGLWNHYEAVLDQAADFGIGGVCLEVSWARLEPRRGVRDDEALAHYAQVIAGARRRGLHVSVAAIDAAWPAWLGLEAWLMPWVVPVAVEYVCRLTSALDADSYCVFAAREMLTRGFLDGSGPPWRRGAREDALSAARNLDEIEARSRDRGLVGFVTVTNLELDAVSDVATLVADEVHVRSLVRGAGPLASARGLLGRRGDEWVLTDDEVAPELMRP